ncbi:uncharacterized protein STEHIDRAFT_164868 [Stereum hirsutum FP-91666 SS1]|uniref:uncharacterized protein n=1 Tax=Stereum hirsutum (strain FP-91666) TaxID=721885 RepID=UPI000440FAA9|nr:uncharacterized protein STEHIDRAFT_164868 [Stereum hirsutum FP-91666 SS1]EIM92620.1 hypothetical protein STEHIDRAFT_164868 [Stereum hirsutum FP-91666 SS1]
MAQQMQAYAQNKGTLVPGQSISVNKYTVQVDRYLSQGGFAHVYLCRTPTPVYGTTHHVLKRIAVPNEGMLSEVKKEVDIMRILKGHPNIVHLIDAAWHRMSNGMYEVFILMDYCAGGGIIDMMNRRLRERLTEGEILQIFVDVCEGVAAMHNLRPALLHRDLKVENILQSSPTSFKLCDFGSATPVARRPPANTQEIRALEADLNRHTTLQYRAPEMVDPYLRRPVDEKSDVWALGVLLYKLCYYTTPFEEHGPLAILNVQYKIPPYPIYSAQMNALIASMLREHGAHRPSAFELLNVVHAMRGTKSQFTYNIPARPSLPPRPVEAPPQAGNTLDNLVSYRSSSSTSGPQAPLSSSPHKNAGVEAREKVLDAIAPMRRGRPTQAHSPPRSVSPAKEQTKATRPAEGKLFEMDPEKDFGQTEESSWKAVRQAHGGIRGHRSGVASPEAWKVQHGSSNDAWATGRRVDGQSGQDRIGQANKTTNASNAFGDSFERMLGSSSSAAAAAASRMAEQASSRAGLGPPRPLGSFTGGFGASGKSKDAFDGLGSFEKQSAPTLAQARTARTGFNANTGPSNLDVPKPISPRPPISLSPRPSPSPSPQPPPHSPSPAISSSWKSQPPVSRSGIPSPNLTAEERFPSLEDLDRVYTSPPPTSAAPSISQGPPPSSISRIAPKPIKPTPSRLQPSNGFAATSVPASLNNTLGPPASAATSGIDGTRSEHVTGAAMRESREAHETSKLGSTSPTKQRPILDRKHRSSVQVKQSVELSPIEPTPSTPTAAQILGRPDTQDWLTGDDDDLPKPPGTPVLRNSLSKRASVVPKSPVIQSPQEAAEDRFPPPEQVTSTPSPAPPSSTTDAKRHRPKPVETLVAAPVASRASSFKNEVLNDNWSPVTSPRRGTTRRDTSSSSGGSEEPEDANGFAPGHVKPFEFKEKVGQGKRRPKSKGRQSSVHDLVDLWGGASGPEKKGTARESEAEGVKSQEVGNGLDIGSPSKGRSEIRKPANLTFGTGAIAQARTASPQPLLPTPNAPEYRDKSPSPPRPSSRHRKQSSTLLPPPSPISQPQTSVGRSRPQSMFVPAGASSKPFPTLPESPKTPSLNVPPDVRAQRQVRRSSITDMVQRYEAMGGKPIAPATTTKPPLHKVATHGTSSSTTSGPVVGALNSAFKGRSQSATGHNSSLNPPEDGSRGSNMSTQRTSPTGLPRSSPVALPGLASPERKPHEQASGRRSPFKPPQTSEKPAAREPPPKVTIPRASTPSPPSSEEAQPGSGSPDKPYQGVGRLIDQWQRKAVDSDGPKGLAGGAKRGAYAARRTGVVEGRGH